ncbi:MAG: AAA family ATPase [Clostridia bacterium]|nr:AAA family ATPase [Clostridia bacterium]
MKRKIFVFIGAPASGKGTRINECVGYKSISTSCILKNAGYDLTKGTLISDEVVNELVIREMERLKESNIILDGFPRTENQFLVLLEYNIQICKVFYIKGPKDILFERANDRLTCTKCQSSFTKSEFKRPKVKGICDYCGGTLVERVDDSRELFEKRIEVFEEKTKPVLKLFQKYHIPIVEIDATLPPSEILKYI